MSTLRRLRAAAVVAALLTLAASPCRAVTGDINGDSQVTVLDVVAGLRVVAGLSSATPEQITAGDVLPRPGTEGRLYGDARIGIDDVLQILRYLAGLVTPEQLAPVENTTLYTLNGRAPLGVDGYATSVDLAAFFANPPNAGVVLDAFRTGSVPNHMVVRGNLGYIANSGSNSLQIVDLDNPLADAVTIDLGVGTNPYQLAVVGNKAYVSLLITNQLAVVDLTSRQVSKIAVGNTPAGVLATRGKVYVANSNYTFSDGSLVYGPGTVSVVDTATDAVVGTISVGTNPQDMALDSQGRVHLTCTGDYADVPGSVYVISPVTDTVVGTVELGGTPGNLTINFQDRAYVADGSSGITSYDARTLEVLLPPAQAIRFEGAVLDVASDSRGRVYGADFQKDLVKVIDPATNGVIAEIPVGTGPEGLALR